MIEYMGGGWITGRLALRKGEGRVRVYSDKSPGFGFEPFALVLSPCVRGEARITEPGHLRLE